MTDNLEPAPGIRAPFAPPPANNAITTDTASDGVTPPDSAIPEGDSAAAPAKATTGSLDLAIVDARGDPIAKLDFKIVIKGDAFATGTTDHKGQAKTIEDLPIDKPFEVHVRKDNKQFKLAAIGTIRCEENTACLKSPKTRFEFSTYSYDGAPGTADKHKEKLAKQHNQTPAKQPTISGNSDAKPQVKEDRDANGKPKVTIIDGLRDMFGRNGIAVKPDAMASASEIEHVKRLIEFGERQAGWNYAKRLNTVAIIDQMRFRKFKEPQGSSKQEAFKKGQRSEETQTKEGHGYQYSVGACATYVKVALWYAGYGPENEPIGNGVQLAREMGPPLLAAGFKDVTKNIPDGRWAAPGDVIVYQRKGAPDATGHIDIRTYDGYLSDFLGSTLPTSLFDVTGIYRKYSDPEPEKRMRAFLIVLREWECHEEKDDEKRYFLMFAPINGSRRFTDTSKHPYEGVENFKNSPAGAYQFNLGTYRDYSGDRYGIGPGFSPTHQDRFAAAYLEVLANHPLSLIRQGKIEEAVRGLPKTTWSSLPDKKEPRRETRHGKLYTYVMSDLLERYQAFLDEQKGK